jgi:hypothetical protein
MDSIFKWLMLMYKIALSSDTDIMGVLSGRGPNPTRPRPRPRPRHSAQQQFPLKPDVLCTVSMPDTAHRHRCVMLGAVPACELLFG